MNSALLDRIITMCPDTPMARHILSRLRVQKIKTHYISQKEIRLGEASTNEKERIVSKYCEKWPSYLKKTIMLSEKIQLEGQTVDNCPEGGDIRTDILFCRLAYGFQADEYLCFDFENLPTESRKKWVSDMDRYIAIYRMNDQKAMQLLNNKARTYEILGEFYGRDAICIQSERDFGKYEAFVRAHPVFVKKQVYEGMGRSVELIDMCSHAEDSKDYFLQLIKTGEHILEEKINQSTVLARLNKSSVNTVRCITFRTRHGIIAPFTFMKIGRQGSFVDNGGAGGILVCVNRQTGELDTDGYDENNIRYIQHPDSGVIFKGYQLPDWEKMIDMCKTMSERLPKAQCIGWDLAYTDKGWVVVEGNGMTQFIGPQIVYKKGIKEELAQIMADMDLML